MKFRLAQFGLQYPEMTDDELGLFCHKLSNLDMYAVYMNPETNQIAEEDSPSTWTFYAMLHFMGWKWSRGATIDVVKRKGWPEPDFVKFVNDMAVRLGIVKYDPSEGANKAAMRACISELVQKDPNFMDMMARPSDGNNLEEFAYAIWCSAHNRGKPQ